MNAFRQWYRSSPAADLMIGAAPAAISLAVLLYGTPRDHFPQLIGLWMLLFGLYAWWLSRASDDPDARGRWAFGLGILLRLIATFALPALSDDYFRFLWDGQLILNGVNPFTVLPADLAADPARLSSLGLDPLWFARLNSPEYFTIYPPVLQGIFVLGALSGSIAAGVITMKLIVLAGEVATLWLLRRLLRVFSIRPDRLIWYALNPLVIVELCGILHFEALIIPFLLAAIWLLWRGKETWSAVMLGLAVATKLLPLMVLPFLVRRIGWLRTIRYGIVTMLVVMVLFLPLLSPEMLQGFRESLSLYVNRFEFNAGLWYLVRWIGEQQTGWNLIRELGPWMTVAAGLSIGLYALLSRSDSLRSWPATMLHTFTLYFLFSLIVHPWYISTLVALAPLSRRRYPLLWSLWLPWTYLAYSYMPVQESLWLVGLEYATVIFWMLWENIGKGKLVD